MGSAIYYDKIDKYDNKLQQLKPQTKFKPLKSVKGYITTLEKTEKDNIFKLKRFKLEDL